MGHCTDCGAPCSCCVKRSDFTLLRLAEPVRSHVRRLLDEVGVKTNERTNRVVTAIAQYPDDVIKRTFRIWNNGGYATQGKDERYFLGILRTAAIAKKQKLEPLAPLIEYDEEESIE